MNIASLIRFNTPGPDELDGTDGPDTLEGLGGDDTLRGLGGNDSLDGGDGRDRLEGGDGDDTLDASGGSAESQGFGDYVRPGLGSNTIFGHAELWDQGGGIALSYGPLSEIGGLTVTLNEDGTGTAVSGTTGQVNDNFTFANFFEGSQDDDLFTGSNADRFEGFAPLGGSDTVNGGGGYDQLNYSFEADYFDGAGSGITVDWAAGTVIDTQNNLDVFSGIEEIRGSQFGDVMDASGTGDNVDLRGEDGNDTITGGSGNDRLRGGPGNDSILGGDGDDTINDNRGLDTVDAGPGNDTYERNLQDDGFTAGEFGVVTVDLEEGLLFGGTIPDFPDIIMNFENARLSGGDDFNLIGTDGDNELRTGDGNDTIIGGGGRDRLISGDGDDLLDASGGSAESQGFGDQMRPGLGSDTMLGHAALWETGEGVQVSYADLEGIGGMTITVGVDGDGTAVSGTGGLVDDTFTYVNYVEGSQDDDLITGSDEDRFQGYAPMGGDDTINGGGGFDQLHYNYEVDFFDGEGDGITVNWAAGTVIDTQGNTDTFTGIESVRGSQTGDLMDATGMTEWTQLRGEGGDDTLIGGEGDNRFRGGDGNDIAVINVNEADATITVDGSNATVESAEGFDELEDIETIQFLDGSVSLTGEVPGQTLIGVDDADDLTGNEGDDSIFGKGGDDTLDGAGGDDNIGAGAGNDVVNGGEGNDFLGGGQGDDSVDGGDGNDIAAGGAGNDTVSGGEGDDGVYGGSENDMLSGGAGNDVMGASFGNDTIDGGDGNDDIGGGTGKDEIDAGAGNDSVGGGEGDDTIRGLSGDDFLAGGGRNDNIVGGAGNDTINGGDGDDRMTGGAGADVFVFNFFKDGDEDVISDFSDGEDLFLIRLVNPEDGTANLDNGGNGIQGYVDALNITDVAGGAQMDIGGHLVLVQGVSAADLTKDDFVFV